MSDEKVVFAKIPAELKLRLDMHCKIKGMDLKDVVIDALDDHLPVYFVKLQE
jgi:hypothetical protein